MVPASLNRLTTLLIILILVISGCISFKKHKKDSANTHNVIVYRVFDSLEQELCGKINYVKVHYNIPDDSIYVRLEPAGDFTNAPNVYWHKEGLYIYLVGLFYEHYYPKDSIFEISNRKMEICGKLYPVYFTRIDDIFCSSNKLKNYKFQTAYRLQYDLSATGYYEVDMINKKILHSTMGDATLKNN